MQKHDVYYKPSTDAHTPAGIPPRAQADLPGKYAAYSGGNPVREAPK